MFTRRAGQRHIRSRQQLRAAALVFALAMLGVASLAAGPPAGADGVTVTPSAAPLFSFRQFSVSGFAPGGVYTVVFNGVSVGEVVVDVEGLGSYQGTFSVPAAGQPGAPVCGQNSVVIQNEAPIANATISVGCPAIQVTPSQVSVGELPATFTVVPRDFPPPVPVLSLDGVPQATTAAGSGALDFTATPACGTHRVVLSAQLNGVTYAAGADIFVGCAVITLDPSRVNRSREPVTIHLSGTGFHPRTPVTVSLASLTSPATGKTGPGTVGGGTTDAAGAISTAFPARGLACGTYQVRASERPGTVPRVFAGEATLTVAGCAHLAAEPAVIEPGTLTHVTGQGFTPRAPVTLVFDLGGGRTISTGTTVRADAAGRIDTYLAVTAPGVAGACRLLARQADTTAGTGIIVDPGSMEPTTGGVLIYRR